MMNLPKMKTVRKCAEETGLAYSYLLHLVKTKKITFIRCGNRYMINEQSLNDFLNTGDMKEGDTIE